MPLPRSITRGAKRFNPYAVPLARRFPPFAVVYHVGRRSGHRYRTPVVAFARRRPDGGVDVAVTLPYGAGVDWVRNAQAADGFVVERASHGYEVDDLRILHGDEALAVAPWAPRTLLRVLGVRDAIVGRLRRM
jgi:hypothetical protein